MKNKKLTFKFEVHISFQTAKNPYQGLNKTTPISKRQHG